MSTHPPLNPRIFNPYEDSELFIYFDQRPSGITEEDAPQGVTRLKYAVSGEFLRQPGTVVVRVAGRVDAKEGAGAAGVAGAAAKQAETPAPRTEHDQATAFYSVTFSRTSSLNTHGAVLPATPALQTLKAADLMSACKALELVQTRYLVGRPPFDELRLLVVQTTSTNLYHGITRHVYRWERGGWVNGRGEGVACRELWVRLQNVVSALEGSDVRVAFWMLDEEGDEGEGVEEG